MELPRDHHYKPAFFLSRWAGADGLLCAMRLVRGKVIPHRRHPNGTGKLRDLYRIDGVAEAASQHLEINFMSPLDNGAARALDRIYAGQPFDAVRRSAWTRFIVSLLYRHPECVDMLKRHMGEIWDEGTKALEAEYAANRHQMTPETLEQLTSLRRPAVASISASDMLAEIINDHRACPDVFDMHWTVCDLSQSRYALLTSDRPIVMPLGLADRRAYIALPIGPSKLFIAAYDDRFAKGLTDVNQTIIAKMMNKDVVAQARQFVWGVDDAQIAFVRKYIATAPDRVIITEEQRQEAIIAVRGDAQK